MGIYNGFYSSSATMVLPIQTVSLKTKLEKPNYNGKKSWCQEMMDSLETIGKSQYGHNLKLIENYEMVKGRFIFSHYFHTEGYDSLLTNLQAQFELPNYLRHYDIIGKVINTLSGEWQKRPDTFKVRQVGDGATNEYLRTKQDLTKQYIFGNIESEINNKLIQEGIDPNKSDFDTPEEQQAYQEQISQYKQSMTPPEIQKFMDTDFLTKAEIWAQHQHEYDIEFFNLPEIEKVEFEDMLIADRCFRHFYVTNNYYGQETWNPVSTFYHKSPDVRHIEDGDYVGRIFNISINTIIDRYGHLMNKDDFDMLINEKDEKDQKWRDSQFNWVYDNYLMPFKGYPGHDIMRQSFNVSGGEQIPQWDESFYDSLNRQTSFNEREGFYFVTEGYWKTQKKLIKITYFDPETAELVVTIVDENFMIPDYFTESDQLFTDSHQPNSYCETWVNEVWKGVKINTGVDKKLKRDLYLTISPNDFQFKGDFNMYGCKLPVCGQIFSVRNSHSMSLVDMMKPHQIGHNVAMNQLYQLAEKEVGMFMVMDVNMFPNSKDWGGEDSWGKWMIMAKNLGLLPADTSPQNIKQSLAATGGFLPKVLDLNLAGQMVSRQNMAVFFEEQALKQIGFNNYRLGNFTQSATATGVQQGQASSYAQTESYFTNFSNYLRRCNQMSLSIAQFIQSQRDDITFTYTKSDTSRAFIKVLGIDLILAEIGVVISNSQEHIRQLEMIRRFALENNTAGLTPPDIANVIMMNNPNEIKRQLELGYKQIMGQQENAQKLNQQALDQEKEIKGLEIEKEDLHFYAKLENELDIAKIQAGAAAINSSDDITQPDNSGAMVARENNSATQSIKRDQLELSRNKAQEDNLLKREKMALDKSKQANDLHIQRLETHTAEILKSKKEKDKKK